MKQVFSISLGEESYGLVYENSESLFEVWEIPQYGGEERFYKTFDSLDDAIKVAKSLS